MPGATIGRDINPAPDAATWNAYDWDGPPPYLRPDFVYKIGAWRGPMVVLGAVQPSEAFNDFAYRLKIDDVGPGLPVSAGINDPPAGWDATTETFPAWAIARELRRVGEANGISDPDPDAGPKPTYDGLVVAAAEAHVENTRNAIALAADDEARRRIAIVYHPDAGYDRSKEWEVRLGGGDMAARDTERVRLVAVCHALEARIAAAATISDLGAIDVDDDAVWAPPEEDG